MYCMRFPANQSNVSTARSDASAKSGPKWIATLLVKLATNIMVWICCPLDAEANPNWMVFLSHLRISWTWIVRIFQGPWRSMKPGSPSCCRRPLMEWNAIAIQQASLSHLSSVHLGSYRQTKIKDSILVLSDAFCASTIVHGFPTWTDNERPCIDHVWYWHIHLLCFGRAKAPSQTKRQDRPAFQMHSAETRSTEAGMPPKTATVERLSVMDPLYCVCDMDLGTSTDLFQHVSTNCFEHVRSWFENAGM